MTPVTGQEWINQSAQALQALTNIQARMSTAQWDDYTVPNEYYHISERVMNLAKVILLNSKEQLELDKNIKNCNIKCREITDQLNSISCLIAQSLLAETRRFIETSRGIPCPDLEQASELSTRIEALRAVNKSLKANYHLDEASRLLEGEKPIKIKGDEKRNLSSLRSSTISNYLEDLNIDDPDELSTWSLVPIKTDNFSRSHFSNSSSSQSQTSSSSSSSSSSSNRNSSSFEKWNNSSPSISLGVTMPRPIPIDRHWVVPNYTEKDPRFMTDEEYADYLVATDVEPVQMTTTTAKSSLTSHSSSMNPGNLQIVTQFDDTFSMQRTDPFRTFEEVNENSNEDSDSDLIMEIGTSFTGSIKSSSSSSNTSSSSNSSSSSSSTS